MTEQFEHEEIAELGEEALALIAGGAGPGWDPDG